MMAPLTRSAASVGTAPRRSQVGVSFVWGEVLCFGCLLKVSYIQAPPKEPEIINIDEDKDEEPMDEDEMYDEEEELEEDEVDEDEAMDETMDDVNGDGGSETASAFPALEPSLKSVVGFSGRTQGLF